MKWLVILFALVSVAVASESHSIEKRTTTVSQLLSQISGDSISSRLFSGVSLTTVGLIIFGLIIADVILTVLFATVVSGRSSEDSWGLSSMAGYVSTAYNSIDMVDTTFNVMDVESEVCRKRAVCEVESVASSNPLFSLVVNTVNSNLRGLERYSDAVEAGLGGEDCALAYDECPHSFLAQLPTFF